MISELHFLRPWWFIALIPLLVIALLLWRQTPKEHAWSAVCDPHLLKHLLQNKTGGSQIVTWLFVLLGSVFMILSLTGPSWYKLPVATYKPVQPRVLILDMSEDMLQTDLTPNRLSRAKFKLHDILSRKDIGQFGLIVYTGEPFVVSPLTDDGQTIASLLSSINQDVMPVSGQNLNSALKEARQLMKQAGYQEGQILVLTSSPPSSEAIKMVKSLAKDGISSSIMPLLADSSSLNPGFQQFAQYGNGALVPYTSDSRDLNQWINLSDNKTYSLSKTDEIPLWRDEGRWFLIPALLCVLPLFRRGWSQRAAL